MTSAIVRITDPGDERLAAYRDIRERDLIGRRGRFVAEGKVVLSVLLRESRFATESILLLGNRLVGLADLIALVPDGVPVYVAGADVLDAVAGFHVHRGVLAIGRIAPQPPLEEAVAAVPDEALVVVMAGISNHDNAGSIFRNAAAFEADLILLDETCCDPLYRKAIRVSVGAALKVPFVRGGTAGEIAVALTDSGYRCLALSPRGVVDIAELPPGGRTALFLGTEGDGLPADILSAMETVRIDMSKSFDSLNVAAASAIALHRLWRGGS